MNIEQLLNSEDIEEKYGFEYDVFPDKDSLLTFLSDNTIPYDIVIAGGEEIAVIEGQGIFIYLDSEPSFIPSEDLDDFIYRKGYSYSDDVEAYVNKKFWESPKTLYHATPDENIDSILKDGIYTSSDSRGVNNSHISSAVFTVSDIELLLFDNSYGDNIIEISTSQMKADGFTPLVEREPSVIEAIAYQILANKIKHYEWEHQIDSYTGEWEETYIIYDDIPPKYISLFEK